MSTARLVLTCNKTLANIPLTYFKEKSHAREAKLIVAHVVKKYTEPEG
jgi:hypothetical protein